MNWEQTYGLIFAQNIGVLGNNMMFTVSTLLASLDVSVILRYFIKLLSGLEWENVFL